jgi:hypothetical protein
MESDRMVVDEMLARLSPNDRQDLESAERTHRWLTTPQALFVNGATGEMISPSGLLSDEDVARLERMHRETRKRLDQG